jgi:hypothetical protein
MVEHRFGGRKHVYADNADPNFRLGFVSVWGGVRMTSRRGIWVGIRSSEEQDARKDDDMRTYARSSLPIPPSCPASSSRVAAHEGTC